MAVCKRPAAAVDCKAHAKHPKKRRVPKKTTLSKKPAAFGIIKKPVAFSTAADYEESCLGEGASGDVYKASNHAMGQTVALNFIVADPGEVLRAASFLEACSGNQHIVGIGIHCIVHDPITKGLFIVMEFIQGQSLHEILHQRRRGSASSLPEATVRAFMRQLLTGAKGIHDRNIVHWDIKPKNILVEEEGGEVLLRIRDFDEAISVRPAAAQPGRFAVVLCAGEFVGGGEKLLLLLKPVERTRLREKFLEEKLSVKFSLTLLSSTQYSGTSRRVTAASAAENTREKRALRGQESGEIPSGREIDAIAIVIELDIISIIIIIISTIYTAITTAAPHHRCNDLG
ncbi:hypothetical protein QYE76_018775 [Lolium multiflorum]|uniref:Protein kinase domain-containing protein n=1 Tax=Lolium multiflorum TaxID=4521 RepID=A0AAD8QLB5_LOLMU|nr:hypothetical protein QYE76_018775 [Lolium multiflorum]